jgi:hypothetical protein
MKVSFRFAAALVGACLVFPHSVQADFLTGLNIFGANADGSFASVGCANTFGGDTYSNNLYLLPGLPSASLGGAFLNSGNLTTLPTRIDINLNVPGTYSFTALGDAFNGETYTTGIAGLNLFFDGNDINPGISVFAPVNTTSAANFPTIAAIASSQSTATLDPLTLGLAPGAGSLSFVDGGSLITLTEFRESAPNIFNVDRVSGFDIGSNGQSDGVIEFTLQVSGTAVPEPSTFTMSSILLGMWGIVWSYRRLKRTVSAP